MMRSLDLKISLILEPKRLSLRLSEVEWLKTVFVLFTELHREIVDDQYAILR